MSDDPPPSTEDPLSAILRRSLQLGTLPPGHEQKRLRRHFRISQREVAEALGVRRETVSRWEDGTRQPSRPYLDRYCEMYGRLVAIERGETAVLEQ